MNINFMERDRVLVRLIFEAIGKYLKKKKSQSIFKKFSAHFNQKEGDDFRWHFQFFVYHHLSRDAGSNHVVSEFVAYYIIHQLVSLEISELTVDEYEFVARVFFYTSKFLTSRNQPLQRATRNFWKKHIQLNRSYMKKIVYMPPKSMLSRDSTFKIILVDTLPDLVSIWPTDERQQDREQVEDSTGTSSGLSGRSNKKQVAKTLFTSTLASVVSIRRRLFSKKKKNPGPERN